jgi:hypothetical protein
MIKKLLKFAVGLAAIKWIAKKVNPQQNENGKQVEPFAMKLRRQNGKR